MPKCFFSGEEPKESKRKAPSRPHAASQLLGEHGQFGTRQSRRREHHAHLHLHEHLLNRTEPHPPLTASSPPSVGLLEGTVASACVASGGLNTARALRPPVGCGEGDPPWPGRLAGRPLLPASPPRKVWWSWGCGHSHGLSHQRSRGAWHANYYSGVCARLAPVRAVPPAWRAGLDS